MHTFFEIKLIFQVILTTRKKHIFQRLRALHKLQYGLSVEDAEKKFIEYSQKSPDYGLLLYRSQLVSFHRHFHVDYTTDNFLYY